MLFFNYKGGRKNPDDGLEGAIALLFFPLPSFADYVSRAPLLADDKQNFHVLCIINPSLPLFMPTRPLSPAHAWIAKESALQLELIDILRKKKERRGKNWKSLSLSRRFLNGLISLQSQPSKAGRQAEQIESVSMFAELGPERWNVLAPLSFKVRKLPFIYITWNTFLC